MRLGQFIRYKRTNWEVQIRPRDSLIHGIVEKRDQLPQGSWDLDDKYNLLLCQECKEWYPHSASLSKIPAENSLSQIRTLDWSLTSCWKDESLVFTKCLWICYVARKKVYILDMHLQIGSNCVGHTLNIAQEKLNHSHLAYLRDRRYKLEATVAKIVISIHKALQKRTFWRLGSNKVENHAVVRRCWHLYSQHSEKFTHITAYIYSATNHITYHLPANKIELLLTEK